jgi:parallel beta-helix repeat protein
VARLLGPDAGSKLVYVNTGNTLRPAAGRTATVYADAAGTTLANIATYDGTATPGAVIVGSTLTVDADSLLPTFWFPDGVDTVYVSVTGGTVTKANADYDARLDAADIRAAHTRTFNVFDYGAVGAVGNAATDTAAIHAAWADLVAAGGGEMLFPRGTYETTGILLRNGSNFRVRGDGGAVLTIAGNTVAAPNRGAANVLTIADCTDFSVEGLTVDGRRDSLFPVTALSANAAAGQPSVTVAAGQGARYVVGQRLNLCGGLTVAGGADKDKRDHQVVVASITPGTSDTITFTANIGNAYTAGAGLVSDSYGPMAAHGAYVTPWQTGDAIVADRHLLEEDQQQGIHLVNCDRFRIAGCTIRGMWESGIRMGTHLLDGTAQLDGCTYGTITGNRIYHCYDQGVGVWCSQHITVSDNVIDAAGWCGVCLTMSDDCTVSGNICDDQSQRIPTDTGAGHGLAIEGGMRNTLAANKATGNYGSGIYLTAAGTLPFGGPGQVATTVAAASDATALPTGTVNVASTVAFAAAGQFTVLSSAGAQPVTYTAKTATSFTGCTGGIGTLYTGERVTQYPVFINQGAALSLASDTVTVSDGTKFQVGGYYSIVDGPRTERVTVSAIAGNVLTLAQPTAFTHPDKSQFSQAICDSNTIVGNVVATTATDHGIRLGAAVRTVVSGNVVDKVALRGIDLVGWTSGGLQPPCGTVIANNIVTAPNIMDDGGSYEAIGVSKCSDVTITGNRCSGATSTTGYFSAIHLQACTDCVVSGNQVADAYALGMRLDNFAEYPCKRVQVTGNEILRVLGEGLLVYGGDSLAITGNVISGCAPNNGPEGYGGALNLRGVRNSQILANTVVNNGHGGIGLDDATLQGVTVHCSGNMVAGNISRDDGANYDVVTGALTQQGSGIKELAAGQGPNTYLNNLVSGNITNWDITSTGNTLRGNQNYNPVGKFGAQPAVPASTVAYTNILNADATVHVAGGTVSAIAVGGQATGLTATPATVRVPAGQSITLTYSVPPTWTWFGD